MRKLAEEELIPKYHQHLIDFSVRVEYIFIDKTPKRKGKEVWGSCKKVTNLNAFLANEQDGSDPFFVIVISEPIWDVLSPDKRLALVDFYLCQAWAEANQKEDDDEADPVKLVLLYPDLEEFTCIVRRHGLWRDGVKDFVETATRKQNDKSTGNESKSTEPSQSEGV